MRELTGIEQVLVARRVVWRLEKQMIAGTKSMSR
jgi:hypothetical protein